MKKTNRIFAAKTVAVAFGTLMMSTGCTSPTCEETLTCGPFTGGTPPECIPSANPEAVGDECGVFVSDALGDDSTGEGTKNKPFKTIGTALMRSNGKPVYLCAETFKEAVVLPSGTELYGGLVCRQEWIWDQGYHDTFIHAGPNQIAITLSSGSKTTKVDNVQAWSMTTPRTAAGASTVAIMAEAGAVAELTRCTLNASPGVNGAEGISGAEDGTSAASGEPGNAGGMACSAASVIGGLPVETMCGDLTSAGGSGGFGNQSFGGNGQSGLPALGAGEGGIGEPMSGSWSCTTGNGGTGENGISGMPGLGGRGMGILTASGYIGVAGGDGSPAGPGQGGGGGGGAKGGLACATITKGGASGGSGGGGGCGGLPGKGGRPGGASIGLISLNAKVTLRDSRIYSGYGGYGGKGGDPQAGGAGGPGGPGGTGQGLLNPGCKGGDGGKGGNGGPGGGGSGGPSIGIAYVGSAPEQQGTVIITTQTPGTGGPGGNMNVADNAGEDGFAAEIQEF